MVLPQYEITFSLDNDPATLIGTEDEILTVIRVLLRSGVTHGRLEVQPHNPVGQQTVKHD